jgi:phosphonate transport system ATP-binding protein
VLRLEHLTKVYDDGTRALNDVSFEVPDGQFLVIIGLSGSGKSTLLRCINRLIEPTEGRVIWNGVDVTAAPQEEMRFIRRRMGMIFQSFNLVKRGRGAGAAQPGASGHRGPGLQAGQRVERRAAATGRHRPGACTGS